MAASEYHFQIDPVPVTPVKTAYREIRTGIPCPGTREVIERLEKYESRSMHGQPPLVWNTAQDFTITDMAGNRFLDFTSTIFVANVGHANRRVIDAVSQTMARPLVHNYTYPTEIRARYLQALIEYAGHGMEKAFLLSAGTETTEAAVKLVRLYGLRQGKRRPIVIAIRGNWHGRTLGAQMLSSNTHQKEWIGYQDDNVLYIDFPYPWTMNGRSGREFFTEALARLLKEERLDPARDICGFMLETFQGWAAAFYPNDFVRAVREFCDEHDALLCFDEMQSGFARTGKAFGYEHYGVEADLLCCGKGMGAGFVVSGVIGKADVMDLPDVGDMSSTHSANPVACAAGLATIEEIRDRGLIEKSRASGEVLHDALQALQKEFPDRISHVLGKGMLAALHFNREGAPLSAFTSNVAERCLRKGLLVVHTGRESIKIGPPLVTPDEALLEGVAVIREAIAEAVADE